MALKIIKHCQEEGAGELPQGILSGLLNNNIVEVTNCFPRPSIESDDFNERELSQMKKVLLNILQEIPPLFFPVIHQF